MILTQSPRSSSVDAKSSRRGREIRPRRVAPPSGQPFAHGILEDAYDPGDMPRRRISQDDRPYRLPCTFNDERWWSGQHILTALGLIEAPGLAPVIDPEDGDDDPEIRVIWSQPFPPSCSDAELAELGLRFSEVSR